MREPRAFDRRLAPRPVPLHLASAMLLWLSSRAGLTSLPNGLRHWSAAEPRLAGLAAEIERVGAEAVGAALDRELQRRARAFAAGIDAYRRHPYRRAAVDVPVLWHQGAARLIDYGSGAPAPAVLIVPSLINRCDILDLLPERSFARDLAGHGLRPLVLDWGEPGEVEAEFALSDYIAGPLEAALSAACAAAAAPVAVLGYCMGGLLALALAQRRPADTRVLALLATPWDFHAERREQGRFLAGFLEALPRLTGDSGPVPVWALQSCFAALDPFLAERKFIRFAGLDPDGAEARLFAALEDWINDGVALARPTALECARSWYRDNDPAQNRWKVAGQPVEPAALAMPALVVLPSRDRIVPPRSAAPLAASIPDAEVLRPPLGHIGMMSSAQAPEAVWRPIAEWLRGALARAP